MPDSPESIAHESQTTPHPNTLHLKPRTKQNILTPKQLRFVEEYVKSLNASQAAVLAGYSKRNPDVVGGRLVKLPLVLVAIQERLDVLKRHNELSPKRILEELRRIATFDYASLYDQNGKLLPIHQMPPEARACIANIETRRVNLNSGDGQTDEVTRIRLIDKAKALEMLGKHLGLLTDKVEHSGTLVIRHELMTGQEDTAALPPHVDAELLPIEPAVNSPLGVRDEGAKVEAEMRRLRPVRT